jgi:hypothetical protein
VPLVEDVEKRRPKCNLDIKVLRTCGGAPWAQLDCCWEGRPTTGAPPSPSGNCRERGGLLLKPIQRCKQAASSCGENRRGGRARRLWVWSTRPLQRPAHAKTHYESRLDSSGHAEAARCVEAFRLLLLGS